MIIVVFLLIIGGLIAAYLIGSCMFMPRQSRIKQVTCFECFYPVNIDEPSPIINKYHSFVLKFAVKFLSLKEKAKCQLVCHQWKDIVDEELRLYQFCLSSWRSDYGKQHEIYKHSPISYIGPVIDKAVRFKDYNKLDAILSRFPNLKCIYLNFLYNEKIHSKTFCGFDQLMEDFFKSKCPKLTHIYVHKAKKIPCDHVAHDPNGEVKNELIIHDLTGNPIDHYIQVIQIKNTDSK